MQLALGCLREGAKPMTSTDSNGQGRDSNGTSFSTVGTGPVSSEAPVTVHTPNGPVPSHIVGGVAVPDKK
jgi:hypothetical protein